MTPRECCVCRREPSDGAPVRFPLLKTAYPLGVECRASWRAEAQSLGGNIYNPAKVQVAFRRWLEAREKVASVDAFSKAVAAICARYNLGADWFPWTLEQNRRRHL